MREKVGKSRNTVFFRWFVAPEGRKVGSLKRRVRSQLATGAMKNCAPLWREAHFEVKSVKNWRSQTTFGSWDVKKMHAVVARSTFPSQNVQNTPLSDHFWKLRCRKSARSCGAKHISKSKFTKHTMLGPLLEVQMSFRFASLQYTTLHYITWRYSTTLQLQLHYTPRHPTTLRYTTLHYTTLHYTTLHCTTFHYTSLHYTTLHSTTLQLQLHNYTPLHSTTLHYSPLHSTTLNYTTLH